MTKKIEREKVISEFIWVDNESKDSKLVVTMAAKNMVAEIVVAPFLLVATSKRTLVLPHKIWAGTCHKMIGTRLAP